MQNIKTLQQPLSNKWITVVLFATILTTLFMQNAHAQAQSSQQAQVQSTEQTLNENNADGSQDDEQNALKVTFNASSASAWMNRLANTINTTSFEITYVVTEEGRETLPYIWRHAMLENGGVAEQLSLLNGPGFERIRFNDTLSVFEPGFTPYSVRSSKIDGPIPSAFIHYPETLSDGYDVLIMGRDRVSGRMAQQLRVVSKDKTRYGYFLWLDEQTGLLLKMNMYSTDNRLLKQVQVTQLLINNDVKKHFANIQINQLPPLSVPNAQATSDFLWTVSYLPVGMQKTQQKLHRLSTTGQPAEYMMLSDGLVDVSVYVMNADGLIEDDLAVSTSATSIASMSNGRIQVTVVGDIPIVTANKIADSIVLVDKP